MYQQLKEQPGKLTLICLGPLTNVARLFREHPDAKGMVKRLVVMGGAIRVGYSGRPPIEAEWNIKSDVGAAKQVFAAGVPLTVVPLDATATVELDKTQRARVFSAHTPLTFQIQALYELWDKATPILFDPVAVALTVDESLATMEDLRLEVDDKGLTTVEKGKANARVATGLRKDAFVKWFVERLRASGYERLPQSPKNLSKLVEKGNFPVRVHVAEDYETDIEKRWWMCGKLETQDVPPGGRRACRATLTQDFDDKMGDTKTTYRAVIFNPVPGPPMGPNTRLNFKYKIIRTDRLRVQLYSLTNGYHRYLSLEGLKMGEWTSAAVDMTQMRRPDGSGGPLSQNERIDDIQFYVDPRAELLISDIVLYEAAAASEKRPFPKRILFTGWFDTGKQGQEWPGDFEIVPHEKPRTWKAARSVTNRDTGEPWIRVSLRGDRRLDTITNLFFRYHLAGADQLRVELRQGKGRDAFGQTVDRVKNDVWSDATMTYALPGRLGKAWISFDEIRYLIPKGGRLLVDDILLYTPE
jgi:hypothetical protein